MRSSRPAAKLLGAALLTGALFLAGSARAADVEVHVTVSAASHQKGPMEQPGLLPPGFDFQSHRVLQSKSLSLNMGQEGKVELPNGKDLKVRPTSRDGKHLMMHVEVEGATTSDLRMRNGKRVTIRHPEPYQGGNLLVHLEANF